MGSRSSARRAACVLACIVASALSSASARAASPEDAAMAESLFREGRALLEAGKIDEACTKLEGSQKLDAKVGTLLNMAACHELQGRTASAWAEFLEAARMARVAPVHDPKSLEQVARARADAIAPKLLRLAIDNPEKISEDVELLLDGRVIPRAAWSTPLPVDPGERILVARAPNKESFTTKLVIGAERVLHVAIPALAPLPKTEDDTTRTTTPPRTTEPVEPTQNPLTSPPFLVAAGVGAVGIGVGAVFGARAISLKKDRDAECDNTGCSPDGIKKQSDAHTAATISTVAFAVGGVSAAFALYWALRPSSAPPRAGAAVSTSLPRIGAGCIGAACAVEVGGRF